jgi:hypothetical protein
MNQRPGLVDRLLYCRILVQSFILLEIINILQGIVRQFYYYYYYYYYLGKNLK